MCAPQPLHRPYRPCWRAAMCCGIALAVLATPCPADTLLLKSGETLIGKVLSEDDANVVFASDALGKISVPRDRIERLEKTAAGAPAPAPREPIPPSAAAEETQPVPAVAEKKKDLFRMWWDQYLLYEVYQPVPVYR